MSACPSERLGLGHLQRIDLFRAMAIIMVFCFHGFGASLTYAELPWAGNFRDYSAAPYSAYLTFYVFTLGQLGVPLFFVISGFCIHLSFLRWALRQSDDGPPQKISNFIWQFYYRRFWRIYPAYLAALALFSWVYISAPGSAKGLKTIAIHAALL